jgi:hypothetical protein
MIEMARARSAGGTAPAGSPSPSASDRRTEAHQHPGRDRDRCRSRTPRRSRRHQEERQPATAPLAAEPVTGSAHGQQQPGEDQMYASTIHCRPLVPAPISWPAWAGRR